MVRLCKLTPLAFNIIPSLNFLTLVLSQTPGREPDRSKHADFDRFVFVCKKISFHPFVCLHHVLQLSNMPIKLQYNTETTTAAASNFS